jgi:hypothetical protein
VKGTGDLVMALRRLGISNILNPYLTIVLLTDCRVEAVHKFIYLSRYA